MSCPTIQSPDNSDPIYRCFTAQGTVQPDDAPIMGYMYLDGGGDPAAVGPFYGTNASTVGGEWTLDFNLPGGITAGRGWILHVEVVGDNEPAEMDYELVNDCP